MPLVEYRKCPKLGVCNKHHDMDGGIIIGGEVPPPTVIKFDRDCGVNGGFKCKIPEISPLNFVDCLFGQFYHPDCTRAKSKNSDHNQPCIPPSGAWLPSVTICRQRYILPLKFLDPRLKHKLDRQELLKVKSKKIF